MSRSRRLQVLALLLVLAPLPVVSDGSVAVLEVLPSPGPGDCAPPISRVTDHQTLASGDADTLSNTSGWAASDSLYVSLTVDGTRRTFWARLDVPARSSIEVQTTYLHPVGMVAVRLCGNPPWGFVESPDPVMQVVVKDPKQGG